MALDHHKLIVNNVTADGASENQSAFNTLAHTSMGKIFTQNDVKLSVNQKDILPLDKKLAFTHPIRENVTIFIGDEMPHLIKNSQCF